MGNPNDMSIKEETGSAALPLEGRFSRKFEDLGSDLDDISWKEEIFDCYEAQNPR